MLTFLIADTKSSRAQAKRPWFTSKEDFEKCKNEHEKVITIKDLIVFFKGAVKCYVGDELPLSEWRKRWEKVLTSVNAIGRKE